MKRQDLVIVGGGTGGLVCAQIAAALGARVALIERERLGGDCLWRGCVPSKTLIASAAAAQTIRDAALFGLGSMQPRIDFAAVMQRVKDVQATFERVDSAERLQDAGVQVIRAQARFIAPHRIRADECELDWRAAIIATGSEPVLPALDGLADTDPLSTDTLWQLERLPRRLLILGGGPTGCELAQAFVRLGAQVTLVELAQRLLLTEEQRAGELIRAQLESEGVSVHLNARPQAVRREGRGFALVLDDDSQIEFDRALAVTGRRPRTGGLGLSTVGVELNAHGAVAVNPRLQTSARSIYAVGDVTGLHAFTHVAAHHARVATPNALFHTRGTVSHVIPRVTFTDPEVAHVGITGAEARERWGRRIQVSCSDYGELDRALTAGRPLGFAQLIGDPHGHLVGATVCAPAAGEVISELAAWITRGARIADVSRTIHAYPTFAEGPARAADALVASRLLHSPARKLAAPILSMLRLLDRS